jgi:hypothetical protein
MAITFRTASSASAATSVAITTPSVGDLILVFAYDNGTSAAPTLATGFTSINTNTTTSTGARAAYKISVGTETTSGTWTGATSVVCLIYRGAVVGVNATAVGNSATVTYPALTLQNITGTSWVVGSAIEDSATAGMTGTTTALVSNRTSQTTVNGLDTNAGVSSFVAQTLTATTTGRQITFSVELKPVVDDTAEGWWAGAQTSFANIALIAASAARLLVGIVVREVTSSDSGENIFLAPPEEYYWISTVQQALFTIVPFAQSQGGAAPIPPTIDEDYWQNYVRPLVWNNLYPIQSLFDPSDLSIATLVSSALLSFQESLANITRNALIPEESCLNITQTRLTPEESRSVILQTKVTPEESRLRLSQTNLTPEESRAAIASGRVLAQESRLGLLKALVEQQESRLGVSQTRLSQQASLGRISQTRLTAEASLGALQRALLSAQESLATRVTQARLSAEESRIAISKAIAENQESRLGISQTKLSQEASLGIITNARFTAEASLGALQRALASAEESLATRLNQARLGKQESLALVRSNPVSATTPLATDNFTRADANPIGGSWTTITGSNAMQIVSDLAEGSVLNNYSTAYWNAIIWPADQWSEITIDNIDGLSYAMSLVRVSNSAVSWYGFTLGSGTIGVGGSFLTLIGAVSGALTTLAPQYGPFTANVGDVVRLSAIGNLITVYINGIQVLQAIDTSIVSGSAGMGAYVRSVLSNVKLSKWSGGGFTTQVNQQESRGGILQTRLTPEESRAQLIVTALEAQERLQHVAGVPIVLVNTATAGPGLAAATISTLPFNAVAGNSIYVWTRALTTHFIGGSQCSDTIGNNYTVASSNYSGNDISANDWQLITRCRSVISNNASNIVTINWISGTDEEMIVAQFSGMANAGTFASPHVQKSSATTATTPSFGLPVGMSLGLAFTHAEGGATFNPPPAGWTREVTLSDAVMDYQVFNNTTVGLSGLTYTNSISTAATYMEIGLVIYSGLNYPAYGMSVQESVQNIPSARVSAEESRLGVTQAKTEQQESRQGVLQTKVTPENSLGYIARILTSAEMSLQLLSKIAISTEESIASRVTETRITPEESRQGVSQSKTEPEENVAGVSQAKITPEMSLAGIRHALASAEASIAVAKSALVEAQESRSAVNQAKIIAEESRGAISQTRLGQEMSLGYLSRSLVDAQEAIGKLIKFVNQTEESLATRIAVPIVTPEEWQQALSHALIAPEESRGGIRQTKVTAHEILNAFTVSQDRISPQESKQLLSVARNYAEESQAAVNRANTSAEESLVGLALARTLNQASLAQLILLKITPQEIRATIKAALSEAQESLHALTVAMQNAEESQVHLILAKLIQEMSLGRIPATRTSSEESISKTTQSRVSEEENVYSVLESMISEQASLRHLLRGLDQPWESTGLGIAQMHAHAQENIKALSNVRVHGAEWRKQVIQSVVGQQASLGRIARALTSAEMSIGKLIKTNASAEENLHSLIQVVILPAESRAATLTSSRSTPFEAAGKLIVSLTFLEESAGPISRELRGVQESLRSIAESNPSIQESIVHITALMESWDEAYSRIQSISRTPTEITARQAFKLIMEAFSSSLALQVLTAATVTTLNALSITIGAFFASTSSLVLGYHIQDFSATPILKISSFEAS